jgi:hypothetical protein
MIISRSELFSEGEKNHGHQAMAWQDDPEPGLLQPSNSPPDGKARTHGALQRSRFERAAPLKASRRHRRHKMR